MAFFPYTVTETNITILFNGTMNKIPRTHAGFNALSAHLKENKHDPDIIASLLDKREAMARLTSGKVKVVGSTVFYKGEPIHSTLAMKLVTMMDEGYDATPWAKFLDNVMLNPSDVSRGCLFDFLERFEAPLTEDGCFIAFKGVRNDYKDCHSGTFDNSPGQIVKMPREKVVEDPSQTCAAGLHACASHYLDGFWSSQKVVAVKINPRDVVSVPGDYNYSKMRVCEYLVIGDVEDDRHRDRLETSAVVSSDSEHRLSTVAPTPLANGYLVPDGYILDPTDDKPVMGDRVIKPGSDDIGIMAWMSELNEYDFNHPQNDEWIAGDIARSDIDVYFGYSVQFDHGTDVIVVRDGEDCGLRVIIEDDEFEHHDEDVVEELTFYHEATDLTFGASEVKYQVSEIGQRGFHRKYGVPRTTVQEWLKAINA